MRQTRILMNMPITVDIGDVNAKESSIDAIFDYFKNIDKRFSPFKEDSEISAVNHGLPEEKWSEEMKEVFRLSEETKLLSDGYFDIRTPSGSFNPSGLVKGWAIHNAAEILRKEGYQNFYVDAGGDIEVSGKNSQGTPWRLGIRDPFDPEKLRIVDVVSGESLGLATSGISERGKHIYNPKTGKSVESDIISLSVIGKDIFEADRFATAAFAMGRNGIMFIEKLPGFEGYMIDNLGMATETSGWEKYRII